MKGPSAEVLSAIKTGLDVWRQKVEDYDYTSFPEVKASHLAAIEEAKEWLRSAPKPARTRKEVTP